MKSIIISVDDTINKTNANEHKLNVNFCKSECIGG